MIFSGKKTSHTYQFKFNGQPLEIVDCFKYLGLTFNYNGRFNIGVKQLKDQGRKAMFAVLQKCRLLDLPITVQLQLFDSLVRPILTYGCEVWGYSCIDIAESLQLEFLKYILSVKKSTPNCFVYGETGQYPLSIHVYSRMIKFWHKLRTDHTNKMSSSLLKILCGCFNYNIFQCDWLVKIKQILDECGISFVWNNPQSVSTDWLSRKVLLNLKDVFIQTWSQQCRDSTKACKYFLYKTTFGTEHYLDNLPKNQRIFLTKIRTSNHKLPIKKGRYSNLPR